MSSCDSQGFSKRKSAVGMPRPKKKKVVLLEEEPEELLMSKDDDTAKDEVPSPTDVTKLEPEPQRGIVLRTVSFRSGFFYILSNTSLRGLGSPLPMWSTAARDLCTRLT